jgi:hypothetical protein
MQCGDAGDAGAAGAPGRRRRRIPWEDWLRVLQKYVEENGICPSRWNTWKSPGGDVYKVGGWLHRQRRAKRRGEMPQAQEEMLDAVYADWKKHPKHAVQTEVWENWLEVMAEYAAAKGALPRVNDEWTRADGSVWRIGRWRRRQQKLFEKNALPPERAAALSETAPRWNGPEPRIETDAV